MKNVKLTTISIEDEEIIKVIKETAFEVVAQKHSLALVRF